MNPDIPIRQIGVLEIKCSFCSAFLREDIKTREEDVYQNQEYQFSQSANRKGWRAAETKDKFNLTLCPDHVGAAKELGLLP